MVFQLNPGERTNLVEMTNSKENRAFLTTFANFVK